MHGLTRLADWAVSFGFTRLSEAMRFTRSWVYGRPTARGKLADFVSKFLGLTSQQVLLLIAAFGTSELAVCNKNFNHDLFACHF